MKKRLRLNFTFLRTLGVVFLFWVAMAAVLTESNNESNQFTADYIYEDDLQLLSMNIEVLEEVEPEQRKNAVTLWRMTQESYYKGNALGITRLYNDKGEEIARSQLAMATIMPFDSEYFDHWIMFDAVLTEEEQVSMAECLREDLTSRTHFYGTANGRHENERYTGLYGEVTGIIDGCVIYPQKLVYHYSDGPVVLVDSSHAMFNAAELTTLKFDSALISSPIAWSDLTVKTKLELYHRANELLDKKLESLTPATNRSGTLHAKDGKARITTFKQTLPDYPVGYAYAYIPWRMATRGLEETYITTFVMALAAAAFISSIQTRAMKKERDLTRAMAHEFKTPAAVMRAYAEALREDVAPERREEYLNTLMEEADRMGNMVNELLELSRMNGAEPVKVREPVDLKAVVEQSFERLRLPMEERGLELNLHLEQTECLGDEKRLERAVSNLALNVLHHAQPGPVQVILTKERILSVENCCPPISPQILARLWEPFYKGDKSRTGEGSGLGLAIVDNIVRLHGGTCTVESTQAGVRFSIHLPSK